MMLHTDGWGGGGGMLTFNGRHPWKMCWRGSDDVVYRWVGEVVWGWWWIRWWSWYLLKLLICWISWYVQDDDGYVHEVDTCWSWSFVEDHDYVQDDNGYVDEVDTLLKMLIWSWYWWMWRLKNVRMSFRPWFSNELWHFCLNHKTTKKTWYHDSYGKNGTSILTHSRKWLKVSFSARTNSEFVRATSDSFDDPANWFRSHKTLQKPV